MTPEPTPSILTASGGYFAFSEPAAYLYDIHTVARALSNICRFTGHCREFYSVAQHSVAASFLVPEEYALEALLHDGHEAFIGDVSTPLKAAVPGFRDLERRVEKEFRAAFGLPAEHSLCVKRADLALLATEVRDLLPPPIDSGGYLEPGAVHGWPILRDVVPLPRRIFPLLPDAARRAFLSRYRELMRRF